MTRDDLKIKPLAFIDSNECYIIKYKINVDFNSVILDINNIFKNKTFNFTCNDIFYTIKINKKTFKHKNYNFFTKKEINYRNKIKENIKKLTLNKLSVYKINPNEIYIDSKFLIKLTYDNITDSDFLIKSLPKLTSNYLFKRNDNKITIIFNAYYSYFYNEINKLWDIFYQQQRLT